jgi:hypothetical protein
MRGVADFIPKLYAVVVGLALLAILGILAEESSSHLARSESSPG